MADNQESPAQAASGAAEEKPAAPAAPIFGAASTFGSGTGFGGFTGLAPKPDAAAAGEDGDGDGEAPEEECAAEFKPVVQLEEVEVTSGEEQETALFEAKCKLYRFDNDSSEWKERGVGQAKLLQHKESQRIRFIMRENKTLKIRSNHVVIPGTKVQEHSGSEKAMVWSCVDFAEEVQRPELFCIRFASAERAQEFKAAYEEACEKNAPLLGGGGGEEEEEGEGSGGESGGEAEPSDADKAADELAAKATVNEEEATA